MARFLAMEAYSKPHYISLAFTEDNRIDKAEISDEVIKDLEKLDPLRRAFQLADWAEHLHSMPGQSTNLNSNYLEIKDKMDAFARGVLTQCHNMDEVETILEHQPQPTNPDDPPKQRNFMKALWEGRVEFVSHPYYQAYFNKRLTGNATMGNHHPFLWHLVYLPFALLLFTFYPLVVFLDYFQNADILLSGNEEKTKGGTESETEDGSSSSRFFAYFRARIHTPVFRKIVHCTIQLTYLILLVVMVWNPIEEKDVPEPHIFHYLAAIITGIFLLEDGMDFYMNLREKEKANFFESYWNIFNLCSRSILFIGLSVYLSVFPVGAQRTENRANLSGNDVLNWSFTLVSIGVSGEVFKILRFLLFFPSLGPLVICIINVMKDVMKTIVVFIIVFSTFGIFLWAMFKPFQGNQQTGNYTVANESSTSERLFHTLFWRILNAEAEGPVSITKTSTGKKGTEKWVSYEFSHTVTMLMWGAYQITIAIVMVNLLIAMMCNTFSEVWKNADKNWKYSRTYYQVNGDFF